MDPPTILDLIPYYILIYIYISRGMRNINVTLKSPKFKMQIYLDLGELIWIS